MIYFYKICFRRALRTIAWLGLASAVGLGGIAAADQFGDFTYSDTGTTITITGYPANGTGYPVSGSGAVVVPDLIVGKPVTALSSAFNGCINLTSVTLPSSVTNIGAYSFQNCTAMTSVNIPSGVLVIGDYAFKNCSALTLLSLPVGLTNIGTETFYLCSGLTTLNLPSSLNAIGAAAFYRCTGLTSITIPANVPSLASSVFYSCSGLQSVTLPPALGPIGSSAFQYCSNLETITIPSTVSSIGNKAFYGCRKITSVSIPAPTTSIGSEVFAFCSELTNIAVAPGSTKFKVTNGALTNFAQTTLLAFPPGVGGSYIVPASVTAISAKAFFTCDKLTAVYLPTGLVSLGAQAFSTCSSLHSVNFTSDAPTLSSGLLGQGPFELAADDFIIYYYESAEGFSSPLWSNWNYPTDAIFSISSPIGTWLTSQGLSVYTDINSDSNGDGVSLLMAYALDLDPDENLSAIAPKPTITAGQAGVSYWSGAADISYRLEWSSDLVSWSTDGVTISEPYANQMRTATVNVSGNSFYVRFAVTH